MASEFKENFYRSLGLASLTTAAVFFGVDNTIGNAVANAFSSVLPANLVTPIAYGGVVFCIGLIYTNFLDDKIESFFRSIY
jgi:hypothetical protein